MQRRAVLVGAISRALASTGRVGLAAIEDEPRLVINARRNAQIQRYRDQLDGADQKRLQGTAADAESETRPKPGPTYNHYSDGFERGGAAHPFAAFCAGGSGPQSLGRNGLATSAAVIQDGYDRGPATTQVDGTPPASMFVGFPGQVTIA